MCMFSVQIIKLSLFLFWTGNFQVSSLFPSSSPDSTPGNLYYSLLRRFNEIIILEHWRMQIICISFKLKLQANHTYSPFPNKIGKLNTRCAIIMSSSKRRRKQYNQTPWLLVLDVRLSDFMTYK